MMKEKWCQTSNVCTEKRKDTALKEAMKDELLGKFTPKQASILASHGKEYSSEQEQAGKNWRNPQNETVCTWLCIEAPK